MERREDADVRKRIRDKLGIVYSDALERNLDLAERYLRITEKGTVVLQKTENLSGKERILLYLVGKLYARKAGWADADEVGNQELMDELGVGGNSLRPWLKSLRDENKIERIEKGGKVFHKVPLYLVDKTLKDLEKKLEKSGG